MEGAGTWPERKAGLARSVAGGGCRGRGSGRSTQDPPSLPAAASRCLGLRLCAVLLELNAHGADVCNGAKWIFKSSFAL